MVDVPSASRRIALVTMPFAAADGPSMQLGLLSSIAEEAGFEVDSHYLNVDLAAALGAEAYDPLCAHRGRMTGEWLFSLAAFGARLTHTDEEYFGAFPEVAEWAARHGGGSEWLSHLRHERLPAFIEESVRAADWGQYLAVGFSSTFEQNVASLALARRIKEVSPNVTIIFGGANMEDPMGAEFVRAFPFVDMAVVGEGDLVFPAVLRDLAAGRRPELQPGLALSGVDGVEYAGQAPPVTDLDALPIPQYSEYFDRIGYHELSKARKYEPALPFESSRGCWWGQKHHCTFCGLNGLGMGFRSKKPERLLEELSELSRRHRITAFRATDNILDMKYLSEFFGCIAQNRLDYRFFYEVKANLTREQVRLLYAGGVRTIQPGIESLSTHVLKLMRKGSTMLQNIRLLKWCLYYKIDVSWNLLWGFPKETEDDYVQERRVLELLSHLQPPGGSGRIWLERFSPYFSDPDAHGVESLSPERSYEFVYPPEVSLEKAAYFFNYDIADTVSDAVHEPTRKWLEEWTARWNSGRPDTLSYRRTADGIFVDDGRGPERRGSHAFYGTLAAVYELCSETMRKPADVRKELQAAFEAPDVTDDDVEGALEYFCDNGLMVSEDGRYLSLAIPANPHW